MRKLSPQEKSFLLKHHITDFSFITSDIPVEYIVKCAQFYNREFFVNDSTLIPRIETEEMISYALNHLTDKKRHLSIIDVGTGSGCIGITFFLELQKKGIDSRVILSDVSSSALEVAKENLGKLIPKLQTNITLIQSNLFENIPLNNTFDIILANLPYIPHDRIISLDSSVKDFEPHIALDGGKTGAEIINIFLQQLPSYLSSTGFAILEIDDTHSLESFQIPKSLHGEIIADLFEKNRFLIISWG